MCVSFLKVVHISNTYPYYPLADLNQVSSPRISGTHRMCIANNLFNVATIQDTCTYMYVRTPTCICMYILRSYGGPVLSFTCVLLLCTIHILIRYCTDCSGLDL